MQKTSIILGLLVIGVLLFGCLDNKSSVLADLDKYTTRLGEDTASLVALQAEGKEIILNLSSGNISNQGKNEPRYIDWATRYATQLEITKQHLTIFMSFVEDNEQALKNEGRNTANLKLSIGDMIVSCNRGLESIK